MPSQSEAVRPRRRCLLFGPRGVREFFSILATNLSISTEHALENLLFQIARKIDQFNETLFAFLLNWYIYDQRGDSQSEILVRGAVDSELTEIKALPIREVATRLGIRILGRSKAMCFDGHDRHTPSLSFDLKRNIWKCFGCGKKGDTLALVMEVLQLDFKHAIAWASTEFRVVVIRNKGHRKLRPGTLGTARGSVVAKNVESKTKSDIAAFCSDPELYSWLVARCGGVSQPLGLNYLDEHGISRDVARRFQLREIRYPARALDQLIQRWGADRVFRSGLAWGDNGLPERLIWTSYAVLFPFFFENHAQFVQGRLFRGKQKFINPRGVAKPLFNVDPLSSLPHGSIVHICEGIPDALALESRGIFAVAVLGATSFRPEWVDLFLRYDVVLMPDGDLGGQVFWKHASNCFRERGKTVRRVKIPSGKDVADVVAKIGMPK